VHEGDEIRDMAADQVWRLNWPAKRRSRSVPPPQDPFGVGRVPPQQPGKPTHVVELSPGTAALPVFGQQRSHVATSFAISTALGGPLRPSAIAITTRAGCHILLGQGPSG
jgi:hypothetical protein